MKAKDRNYIIAGLTTATLLVTVTILLIGKKKKVVCTERRSKISDEGYETAGDILYPLKSKSYRGSWSMN